jgi:hypothetical protein
VRNVAKAMGHGGVAEYASGNEDSRLSKPGLEETADAHASGDESSCTYYFGASMITLGRIHEMAGKGYFAKWEACAAQEETTLEHMDDEVIIFKDFFIASF